MTSNSHERDDASATSGTSSVSGRDGRRGAPGDAPSPNGGSVTGAAGAGTASSNAPTGRGDTSGTSSPTSSRPSGRASAQGTGTAKAKDKGAGGTSGTASKGGDWNVFRTVVVLVGLVIAGFGAYYLILGTAGLPDTEADPVNPTLENQFRFFSAMMVGVGAAFITIAIKFQWANMLWLVCLMVFVGGIGRVLSWAFSGTPNYVLIILMVVELAFPPALLVWHKYIAKTSDLRREFAERG